MSDTPERTTSSKDCAVIEIVEDAAWEPGPGSAGIIKPNDVRINGQSLYAPLGDPVVVHGITLNSPDAPSDDVLKVTLTLFARRVFLGHAKESPENWDDQGE